MHTVAHEPKHNARAAWVCVMVIAGFWILHLIGMFSAEWVSNESPGLTVAMSPSIVHTLRAAGEMSLISFMIINVFRRMIVDPFYIFAAWHGPEALRASRFKLLRNVADKASQWELRVGPSRWYDVLLLCAHFVTADALTSCLIGYRRVNLWAVALVNLTGTIFTVYLMYRLGQRATSFDWMLTWSARGFAISTGLILLYNTRQRIRPAYERAKLAIRPYYVSLELTPLRLVNVIFIVFAIVLFWQLESI